MIIFSEREVGEEMVLERESEGDFCSAGDILFLYPGACLCWVV